jgi:dimethylhistidine N-methyltransferase
MYGIIYFLHAMFVKIQNRIVMIKNCLNLIQYLSIKSLFTFNFIEDAYRWEQLKDRKIIMLNQVSDSNHVDTNTYFRDLVRNGLTSNSKNLCSSCFYDQKGSAIFEKICKLPEYYLTRTEIGILRKFSDEIISEIHKNSVIVELGNGSSEKIRLLLDSLFRRQEKVSYIPIDISYRHMKKSVSVLRELYPNLTITPIGGRYEDSFSVLQESFLPKAIFWFGSSIGNMNNNEAVSFLRQIAQKMRTGDCLIIGMDMVKDWDIMRKAYDDSQGVTAEFNMNILRRINCELNADFDISKFKHKPVCNKECSRMESFIVSTEDQNVSINDLGLEVHFNKNERVHVEVSCKYSSESITDMADQIGLQHEKQWTDDKKWFSLNLFRKADAKWRYDG